MCIRDRVYPLNGEYIFVFLFIAHSLQPQHLTDNAVAQLDCAYEDEHIKEQLSHIAPHLRDRRRIGIDHGRRGRKQGEDDAGQHNDRTLQANSTVAFDEGLAHILRHLVYQSYL